MQQDLDLNLQLLLFVVLKISISTVIGFVRLKYQLLLLV